ncbi:MAG: DedA family protein [Proteobacteria bacterium]|nr:DedA family protein [Pseudomonadota bacterium]
MIVTTVRRSWVRWSLTALVVVAIVATVMFGMRSYRSFLLLRSAYEAGSADVSRVRPWMTLRYVANTYRAPESALIQRLGLSPETAPGASLKSLAERQGISPFRYVQRVQKALVDVSPDIGAESGAESAGWLRTLGNEVLAAVLAYGYPALGATFVLGSIGLPVPTGLATAVAGSLAAQGRINWLSVAAFVVLAQILGDLGAYGLGRVLGREFLEGRGRWIGFTPARRKRAEMIFARWGLLTVLLSRTLVSGLSAVVNLLSGASGYRLRGFLAAALAGRLIWTAAYFGLGFAVSGDVEPAADFLKNVTGFLISLAVLVVSGLVILERRKATRRPGP